MAANVPFSVLQLCRTAPRNPTDPRQPLTFTGTFVARDPSRDARESALYEDALRTSTSDLRRSMPVRRKERPVSARGGAGNNQTESETAWARPPPTHSRMAQSADLARDPELYEKLRTLKSEHERNLQVIEQLYTEKTRAEQTVRRMARSQRRPGSAPGVRRDSALQPPLPPPPLSPSTNSDEEQAREWGGRGGGDQSVPLAPGGMSPPGARGVESSTSTWAQRVRASYLDEGSARSSAQLRATQVDPFAGMEARSMMHRKTRSQQMIEEELRKKQEAEEAELKVRFHARDVPPSTLEARFEVLQEQEEARRRENLAARVQELQDSLQAPVGMMERELERRRRREERLARQQAKHDKAQQAFRARSIPRTVRRASREEEERAEAERRERIARRSAELLATSSLPARMAMWSQTQAARQTGAEAGGRGGKGGGGGVESGGSANSVPHARKVPNFEAMHQQWQAKLAEARRARRPTAPRLFSFVDERSERHHEEEDRKQRRELRLQLREAEEEAARAAEEERMLRLIEQARETGAPKGTTKAAQLRVEQTKRALQERREAEEREAREEAERQRKVQEATARLQPVLCCAARQHGTPPLHRDATAGSGSQLMSESARVKAEAFRRQSVERARQQQQRMEEAVKKQPFLFQREQLHAQAQQAQQTALVRVATTAMGAKRAAGQWKQRAQRSDLFTDQEKDLLAAASVTDSQDGAAARAAGAAGARVAARAAGAAGAAGAASDRRAGVGAGDGDDNDDDDELEM